MKAVKTRLETITVGNGYANTIPTGAVQRFRQSGLSTRLVPFIWIKEMGEESKDGPTGGAQLITNKLLVSLGVGTRQDEVSDTRSGDEVMNSLRGDVVKAMLIEPRTFGGKAISCAYLGSAEIDVEEGEPDMGIRMDFEVLYRHRADDPTAIT
ncbi:MAG: hypothetical protein ACREI9_09335 [Nitrospiraceae bacterium]